MFSPQDECGKGQKGSNPTGYFNKVTRRPVKSGRPSIPKVFGTTQEEPYQTALTWSWVKSREADFNLISTAEPTVERVQGTLWRVRIRQASGEFC